MKLEVGMYVRTDNGIIGRIYEQIGDMFTYKNNNRDYITYGLSHGEILKASFNIIDLIEVGDILLIKDFVDEACMIFNDIYLIQNEEQLLNLKSDLKKNKNKIIYQILTKEQFEQRAYKID